MTKFYIKIYADILGRDNITVALASKLEWANELSTLISKSENG